MENIKQVFICQLDHHLWDKGETVDSGRMGDDIEAEPIENEGVVAPVAEEVSVVFLEVLVEVSSLKVTREVIFLLFFEILLLRVDYVIYINAYSGKGGGARRYWIFTYEKIRDI